MKFHLSALLILLLFSSCKGQKGKTAETKESNVYTDAEHEEIHPFEVKGENGVFTGRFVIG